MFYTLSCIEIAWVGSMFYKYITIVASLMIMVYASPKLYSTYGNKLEDFQQTCKKYVSISKLSPSIRKSCKKYNQIALNTFRYGHKLDKNVENDNLSMDKAEKYNQMLHSLEEKKDEILYLIRKEISHAREINDIEYYKLLISDKHISLSSKDYLFMDKFPKKMKNTQKYIEYVKAKEAKKHLIQKKKISIDKKIKSCNAGNLDSCLSLGNQYNVSNTSIESYKKAVEYYTKACNGGLVQACAYIAKMTYQKKVEVGDEKLLYKLSKKSCDGGSALGCDIQGLLHYRLAEDRAMKKINIVGLKNYRSDEIINKNYKYAAKYFQKACGAGDPEGCYHLGHAYYYSQGVSRDFKKAFELYSMACNNMHMESCCNLGVLYEKGRGGISRDYKKALKLYNKVCDNGNMNGCYNLSMLYEKGRGVVRNYEEATELLTKVCDSGDMRGCARLAVAYANGSGVSKNCTEASRLMDMACKGGNHYACNNAFKLSISCKEFRHGRFMRYFYVPQPRGILNNK
jgi:TPR repeat protein